MPFRVQPRPDGHPSTLTILLPAQQEENQYAPSIGCGSPFSLLDAISPPEMQQI
jgi:hypothetical protein